MSENALIYVETGSTDAYVNFGTEYYFAAEKDLKAPVFLLWCTDPTLMVGKYQNIYEEINMEYARAHNIQLVRRYSGGGTIYTDRGGFQFSFITRNGSDQIEFQRYLQPILQALHDMGIPATFTGRNDLTVEGKKFSGNAQYHVKGTTVHHGSLLFQTDIGQMVESTTVDPYKMISKSIHSVRERVTNLVDHLSEPMDAKTFKEHIIASVLKEGSRYLLTEEDKERIHILAEEKFRSWESIYGASPKFNLQKENHLKGGLFRASMEIKKGRIQSIHFSGDFFSAVDLQPIEEALQGCPFESAAILQVLQQFTDEEGVILYGITPDEMVETIVL